MILQSTTAWNKVAWLSACCKTIHVNVSFYFQTLMAGNLLKFISGTMVMTNYRFISLHDYAMPCLKLQNTLIHFKIYIHNKTFESMIHVSYFISLKDLLLFIISCLYSEKITLDFKNISHIWVWFNTSNIYKYLI